MKPIHILLVEDNQGDELLIREALEESKIFHMLSVMRNGHQAISELEEQAAADPHTLPDLILLDINLPRKSGHEVLQFIKQHAQLKIIPVIMLTTSSSQRDILKSYQEHANCFITKPIDMDDFLRVVTRIEEFWVHIVKLPARV